MSKSGKVVNAYNALLLAEEISKHKKKNIRDGKPGEPGGKNGENGKDGENGKSTYNGKVIQE